MTRFQAHVDDLARLAADDRLRSLRLPAGVDFSSNDYLGFAASGVLRPAMRAAIDAGHRIGSGGSRLLGGNHSAHEALEAAAADWQGAEAALFLCSGFTANETLFATMPQRGDLIVHDALIHASVHDGLRLTRAEVLSAAHNDVADMHRLIENWRTGGGEGRVWIAVESLYSMDGDRAPMADLFALAERQDAVLIVDEAHATGVYGDEGQGLTHAHWSAHGGTRPEWLITLHTLGKALGAEGALLCGPAILRDFLINRGRPFIFSTAPSPIMAMVGMAAIALCRSEPAHRARLHTLTQYAHKHLPKGFQTPSDGSPILPIIIGDNRRTMDMAAALQKAGLDVRGIRPPTVPAGQARLRVTITNTVQEADIDRLFAVLQRVDAA